MECKKCGKDLTDGEYKQVAEWPFCLECFQALMDKAEEKNKEVIEEEPESSGFTSVPTDTQQRCQVCEKEIENSTGREMLGLLFCPECYMGLVTRPDIPPRPETEENEPNTRPAVAQVRVDLRQPVQCHSCGRQIPIMGSKEYNENRYCPDCYYALPEILAKKPKPFPVADSEQHIESGKEHISRFQPQAEFRCQTCKRPVLPGNLKTVDGFEICLACLSTDPNAALHIARARHQKALEQIIKELDT